MKTLVNPIVILFASSLFFCACKKSDPAPAGPPTKPSIVTINNVTNITATTATCGGIISDSSNLYNVFSMGLVCSDITTTPLTNDYAVKTEEIYSVYKIFGEYSSTLTGLKPNTTYYVRAYVNWRYQQEFFVALGAVRTFKTLP